MICREDGQVMLKMPLPETGLSEEEKEALEFTRLILNWRKDKEVIHTGKLKHYIPQDGVYVYFRYNCGESVMVILNNNETGEQNHH
ncbi:MAG: cyclomaltodextrinase C-terminal domain-containing protein [Marinilabiliales bacterium]|nr:cyclomaltodextrinase C-terminal domain-containing protein [Marinilabiliales bacterium]